MVSPTACEPVTGPTMVGPSYGSGGPAASGRTPTAVWTASLSNSMAGQVDAHGVV